MTQIHHDRNVIAFAPHRAQHGAWRTTSAVPTLEAYDPVVAQARLRWQAAQILREVLRASAQPDLAG